jgi:hypothetical protein
MNVEQTIHYAGSCWRTPHVGGQKRWQLLSQHSGATFEATYIILQTKTFHGHQSNMNLRTPGY